MPRRWSFLVNYPHLSHLDALASLLAGMGEQLYGGEAISQLAHALQSGLAAEQDNASPALITAAFLHDIGHVLAEQGHDDLANGVNDHHEAIAVQALSALFDDDVLQPIALHVAAKRYLCAVQPGYADSLSTASQLSLALQGGPMTDSEARRFALRSHADQALALRRYDDLAKVVDLPTPPLAHYLAIAAQVQKARP